MVARCSLLLHGRLQFNIVDNEVILDWEIADVQVDVANAAIPNICSRQRKVGSKLVEFARLPTVNGIGVATRFLHKELIAGAIANRKSERADWGSGSI